MNQKIEANVIIQKLQLKLSQSQYREVILEAQLDEVLKTVKILKEQNERLVVELNKSGSVQGATE